MARPPSPFLTAEWRFLAMLHYQIDPLLLAPLVPTGTEFDSWNEKTFVSVVAFCITQIRPLGLTIPFHRDYDEVNLRFYVLGTSDTGWRSGLVFTKEIVPRTA